MNVWILSFAALTLVVVSFYFLFKKDWPLRAFLTLLFAFAFMGTGVLQKNIIFPTFEQVACWTFAFGALLLSWGMLKKEKHADALITFFLAFAMAICGFTAVQGLLKTAILTKVNESLIDYSKKLDTFQTNIDEARLEFKTNIYVAKVDFSNDIANARMELKTNAANTKIEINKQQGEITNQLSKIAILQAQQASNENAINIQIKTNQELQASIVQAQSKLSEQAQKIASVEDLVKSLYSRSRYEIIDGHSTNNIAFIIKDDFAVLVFFRLNDIPIRGSITGMEAHNETQSPLQPIMLYQANIACCVYNKAVSVESLKQVQFTLMYVKDTTSTEPLISTITETNDRLYFDGFRQRIEEQSLK